MANSIPLAIAFMLGPISTWSNGTVLKCGPQPENTVPLVAIDGAFVASSDPWRHVDRDSIYSLEILCMNPQDSTFHRTVGVPVISIWTMHGPLPQLKAVLALLPEAQDAYFSRHAEYFSDLSAVPRLEPPAPARIVVETSARGWIATGSIDRLLQVCVVYDGATEPPSPELSRRRVTCIIER
ncbi:hypothetical protein BH23GEM9_BH23GEM9_17610 [soil metagenome]